MKIQLRNIWNLPPFLVVIKIKEIVDMAFAKATAIIRNNMMTIEMAAKELLQKETLSEDDLKKYFKLNTQPAPKIESVV